MLTSVSPLSVVATSFEAVSLAMIIHDAIHTLTELWFVTNSLQIKKLRASLLLAAACAAAGRNI